MRSMFLALSLVAAVCFWPDAAFAQSERTDPPANPPGVRLELTMEVATTTQDGLPAALRFTLANIGSVAVEIPWPAIDCAGSNGSIRIETVVRFDGPQPGETYGHGCGGGVDHELPLLDQIRTQWFHLRPGEYLVFTGDRRNMIDKAGAPATYEYRAIYYPPDLTPAQRLLAAKNGYLIPSETVESDSLRYHDR